MLKHVVINLDPNRPTKKTRVDISEYLDDNDGQTNRLPPDRLNPVGDNLVKERRNTPEDRRSSDQVRTSVPTPGLSGSSSSYQRTPGSSLDCVVVKVE